MKKYVIMFVGVLALLALFSPKSYSNQVQSDKCIGKASLGDVLPQGIPPDQIKCDGHLLWLQGIEPGQKVTFDGLKVEKLAGDGFSFSGLATYYNNVHFVTVTDGYTQFFDDSSVSFKSSEANYWWGWKGRFKALLIHRNPKFEVNVSEHLISLVNKDDQPQDIELAVGSVEGLSRLNNGELSSLKYSHLWIGLAILCQGIEWLLKILGEFCFNSWGVAIVLLSLVLKLALMPVSVLTTRFQKQVAEYDAILAPKLKVIKQKYDGEEAHNKIMAEYKELSITPFYTMKPILASLVQIPILVAVFNVLGEFAYLREAPFFWINDLAYPDVVASLGFSLPLFGQNLILLPFLMTASTFVSTFFYQNSSATPQYVASQKRNIYLMGVAFFFLFYPFPSGMVLYWTVANLLQFVERQFLPAWVIKWNN